MFDLHVWMMGEGGGEEGGLDHISLCCFLSGKARIATSENAFYGDYPILSPSEKRNSYVGVQFGPNFISPRFRLPLLFSAEKV